MLEKFEIYTQFSTRKRQSMAEETQKFLKFYLLDFLKDYSPGLFAMQEWLVKKNLNPNTKATLAANLGKFFYWTQTITHDEFDILKNSFRPVKHTWSGKSLGAEEIDKFIRFAGIQQNEFLAKRDAAIFALFGCIGVRISQIHDLDVESIKFENRYLYINLNKKKEKRSLILNLDIKKLLEDAKAGSYNVHELIKSYLSTKRFKPQEALFQTNWGGRLSIVGIRKLVKNLGQTLGMKVTPHTFRHAAITRVANSSAGILKAQILAGHANISTTQTYINPANVEMDEVMN